jgi:hypothetical protein
MSEKIINHIPLDKRRPDEPSRTVHTCRHCGSKFEEYDYLMVDADLWCGEC